MHSVSLGCVHHKLPYAISIFAPKNRIHHVRDMLLSHKNLEFDSVVATDDGLAIGALKYANVKGLKVPDYIEIAGYNNSQLSVGCEPELTSVDNHLEKMCNDTVDYMLRVLQGDTDVPPRIRYPASQRAASYPAIFFDALYE